MEQRRFGNTDLVCSALGFGTWEIATKGYGATDFSEAAKAVHSALDNGITLFDTAAVYGAGESEEVLGKALGNRRKDVIVVTKCGFRIDDAERKNQGKDSSRQEILRQTEGSLRRLGADYVDLLFIHWSDHKTPTEEVIGTLEELKAQGKIRHYGVSNYNIPMMEECQRYGKLTAAQIGYNMIDRRMEREVLPYCKTNGIGFMAYGSLCFGLLTGAFTPETRFIETDWRSRGVAFGLPLFTHELFLKEVTVVDRLKQFAAGYGKTMAQLAIAWVLGNDAVTVALVGARQPSEVEENVKATEWRLSAAERAEIDRIFAEESVPTWNNYEQAIYI